MPGICGVDEAGRGPVLGPMVVAGVLVANEDDLGDLPVRDSKNMSPARREALAPQIRDVASVETVSISAADIDATRAEMTMNELEVNLFATIVDRLKPGVAYLDSADVNAERFGDDVAARLDFAPDIISRHKADATYPVVSAASIVAKVERDSAVQAIGERFDEPIGSGYPSDPVTMEFLERWIRDHGAAPPEARASWQTVKRLLANGAQVRMEEFGDE